MKVVRIIQQKLNDGKKTKFEEEMKEITRMGKCKTGARPMKVTENHR